MKRSAAVVGVVAGVLLAGCGGGGSSYASSQQMATKLGCSNLRSASDTLASDAGDCDFDVASVRLLAFSDNRKRDIWLSAEQRLHSGVPFVKGNRWVVQCELASQAHDVAKKLGGKVA